MKCCGSERRRLRPCVVPGPPRGRARVGGPCRKARAGRYTPRRLLPCARRPGPAPLCSGNERPSGAACSSPGVPNRRRRPWRSPGGCRRRPANGERARARLFAPGASVPGWSAFSPRLPSSPLGWRALWARVRWRNRLSKGFFLLNCDCSARSNWLFFLLSLPRCSSLVSLPSLNSRRVSFLS